MAIQYNIGDNYDAKTIGIFTTKEGAVSKILALIKNEYDKMDDEELLELNEEWFNEDDNEVASWSSFKKIIKKDLMQFGESEGLGYLAYNISRHTVQ